MINPIPFNPDTMTVRAAKNCAETLRGLYDLLVRLDGGEFTTPEEANERIADSVRTSFKFHQERGLEH